MEVTLTEMEDVNVEVDTIDDKVVVLTLVRPKMTNYFYSCFFVWYMISMRIVLTVGIIEYSKTFL